MARFPPTGPLDSCQTKPDGPAIAADLKWRSMLRCVGPERARPQGVLQETLRPTGLERSFSRAVDQIAEALPVTAFLFAHGR